MIQRASHLQEERLFDSYLAERGGEPVDPRVAEHLGDCPSCSSRYAELAAFMDTLRRDGDAEADAIFTPERLRLQQQQIVRRLSLVGRPRPRAQFSRPHRRADDRCLGDAPHAALGGRRGGGRPVHRRRRRRIVPMDLADRRDVSGSARRVARRACRRWPHEATARRDVAADDAFLSDLEIALERPHTRELQAFDELTPHVREISDQR